MLIGILGGRLQGAEIAYLAREAGYGTLLIDRDPQALAAGLVDRFHAFDITDQARLHEVLAGVDIVFPATENDATLSLLVAACRSAGKPLVLDPDAYAISSSKLKSNVLFERIGIPFPRSFPGCAFPVIAKPSGGSGSEGVSVFGGKAELDGFMACRQHEPWCIQEFVEGPSYSVEVIGQPGDYQALLVTELFMDEGLDCRKVVAPAVLRADIERDFKARSIAIAEALRLKGIMDVEVILSGERLYFLEIDARFPSQTPIAVYHSTGVNMVVMLADLFMGNRVERAACRPARRATLEHVQVDNGRESYQGEHIMTRCGPLHLEERFFGSERALTSFRKESSNWVATLINKASTLHDTITNP